MADPKCRCEGLSRPLNVWERPPTSQLNVDDWGFSEYEVSYWLKVFGDVFRSESDPARLAGGLAAEHGSVGLYSFCHTPLRRLTEIASLP